MAMTRELTLGSLFDGSGGFPLGGLLAGIRPVWASEIEPFPIRVTTRRFPSVRHYGDISEMNGGVIEPVDVITFGSPCTDMSLAGKRAGLHGKQSCLFYDAVRIVKEMREATDGRYPRFIVWENVAGAFSSGAGRDFQSVLTEIVRVKEPQAPQVPLPEKAAWPYADILMGDGWSLAYRVLDAQGWGVPQRRRRIYLVADFGGGCAAKVLFDTEGVLGDPASRFRSWESPAGGSAQGAGATGKECVILNDQGGRRMDVTEDVTQTLRAASGHPPIVFENHSQDSRCKGPLPVAPAIAGTYGTGGNNQPLVAVDIRLTSEGTKNTRHNVHETDISRCIDTSGNAPDGNQGGVAVVQEEVSHAMTTGCWMQVTEGKAPTLAARDWKEPAAVQQGYIVRRLTPLECARLQGFPDWWCAGLETENPTEEEIAFWREVFETHRRIVTGAKKSKTDKQIRKWLRNPHTDGAEYKMWGNGVALPCVYYVMAGIAHFAQET